MEFGKLKTQIEKQLTNSFNTKSFKNDIFIFNELVLENKELTKLYFLYDELTSNKGLSENLSSEFINESIKIYENISRNISRKTLNEINMWVGHIKCENKYDHIDRLFSNDVSSIEGKVKSRLQIIETLKKEKSSVSKINSKTPLEKVVSVANKTVNEYLQQIDENEKKDIIKVIKEDNTKLEIEFETLKESALSRLNNLKESETESEVINTINETMSKIEGEIFNKKNYLKLKKLNNNI